jgi:hypothetical protein
MESHNNLELNDLSNHLGRDDTIDLDPVQDPPGQTSHREFSLPPADGGKAAWLFLAAGFVVDGLVWGQFKFQVFLVYKSATASSH